MELINKDDFLEIRKQLKEQNKEREKLIKKSREIVGLSKKIIYQIHRNELNYAKKQLSIIKNKILNLKKLASTDSFLIESGSYKVAVQEFIEAISFYYFVKENRLITNKELKFDNRYYLLGICDLTGEIVRFGINSVTREKYDLAFKSKEFIDQIFGEMLKFNFHNGEIRKKFDSIKYDLKKLENLVYELKLRGKI